MDLMNATEHQARKGFSLWRVLPLVILVAGLVAFFALGLDRYVGFEALREHRDYLLDEVGRSYAWVAVIYVGAYALMTACSLPGGAVMTIAGGFLFGIVFGSLFAVVGATLGGTAIFLAARTALGDILRAKAGPALNKMAEGFQQNALSYLLFLRLIPVFPFWLVNLVPAFLGVPLVTYVIGTFFGIVPGTVVYASVGNGLGAVLDAGETPDLGIIFRAEILLPIIGLAVLALLPVGFRKLNAKKAS